MDQDQRKLDRTTARAVPLLMPSQHCCLHRWDRMHSELPRVPVGVLTGNKWHIQECLFAKDLVIKAGGVAIWISLPGQSRVESGLEGVNGRYSAAHPATTYKALITPPFSFQMSSSGSGVANVAPYKSQEVSTGGKQDILHKG